LSDGPAILQRYFGLRLMVNGLMINGQW
jgi:hypothetical protein